MKKGLLVTLIIVIAFVGFAGTMAIKGSNTVFPVSQLWIEELKEMYPDIEITLEGAGSTTGVTALFNGTADIGNTSRWLKETEIQKMHDEGKYFIPFVVAYDGIAIVVNNENKLDNITVEQLKGIYTGKINRWSQLNPNLPNQPIIFYSRNTASGTYETFEGKILNGERMDPRARMVESTQLEIDSIAQNPYAIAYTGYGYVNDKVKVLKLEGVMPSIETILTSEYYLSRPLFMWVDATDGFPETGDVKKYITFGMSKRGQELVEQAGYVGAYGGSFIETP
ncbi:MAG: phosphate transport system substrate-binding protein [Thermotogaceae bacterium]|nr:phosphate transport system substrate-binding protein [Thermotogaceae bacterium]